MQVALIGIGLGNPDTLTVGAARFLQSSDYLIGAKRMLAAFAELSTPKYCASDAEKIAGRLLSLQGCERVSVLFSGDTGFYSGAGPLLQKLSEWEGEKLDIQVFPGISSVQYLCAKVKISWEDAKLLSLHGRRADIATAAQRHHKVFVLTGGENGPAAVASSLCEAGLGHLPIWVGENLSYPQERIVSGSAREIAQQGFAPLSSLLICNPAAPPDLPATHGLPDDAFARGDIPMTKAEVRAVSIAALALRQGDTVWDVGAGTGSVCTEAARLLSGPVYAVEQKKEALTLLYQNKERFAASNLHIIAGRAPEALGGLPPPNAVFIGGSGGELPQILEIVLQKNPSARVVINAITLETLATALTCFGKKDMRDIRLSQVAVSRARPVGEMHMMQAQNPVFILSGKGGGP